jgi:hypothetical protein
MYKSIIHIAVILTHISDWKSNFYSNNSPPLQSGTCPMLSHRDVNPHKLPQINNVHKLHRGLKNILILRNDRVDFYMLFGSVHCQYQRNLTTKPIKQTLIVQCRHWFSILKNADIDINMHSISVYMLYLYNICGDTYIHKPNVRSV